jgi:myo-inositol catabolism protein IolS
VRSVVDAALDAGINYFDTAAMYNDGASEQALGEALRDKRDLALIGTKVQPEQVAGKGSVSRALEASLRRLQTDWVDLYMLHWPLRERSQLEDAVAELETLRGEGKVRAVGVSNHGVEQLAAVLSLGLEPVFDELPYSLLTRAIEAEIVPFCAARQIGVLGYMPLMQGLLAGKYRRPADVPASRARTRHFHHGRSPDSRHGGDGAEAETFDVVDALGGLAEELGTDPAVLAIAWSVANPALTCTIVGMRRLDHVRTALEGANLALDDRRLRQLDEATKALWERLGDDPDYFEATCNSRIR